VLVRVPVTTVLIMVLATAALAGENLDTSSRQWSEQELALFATLPIQDGGRVKPLDTFAGYTLLKFNGRRTCRLPGGEKRTALEWLLDCVFYPEQAAGCAIFSVNGAETLVSIGVTPHNARRSRYTYEELAPAREKLFELAARYAKTPADTRTTAQTQLVYLAQNVAEYEALAGYAEFARQGFAVEPAGAVAAILGQATELRLSDILAKAPALHERYLVLRRTAQEGDQPPAPGLQAFRQLFNALDAVRETAHALALFPPEDPTDGFWHSPADLVLAAFDEGLEARELGLLADFERLVRSRDDRDRFSKDLAAFHEHATALAGGRGEYDKIALEVAYYKTKPFHYALVLYLVCFVLVAFTWLMPHNRVLNTAAPLALVPPTLLLIAGIAWRCLIRSRPPVTTLYETILFVTAVVVVLSLAYEYLDRKRVALSVGSILAVFGMFLAIKYEAREGADTMPSMAAVLDTNFWLAAHVTTIVIGYGAGLFSAALGHLPILCGLIGFKRDDAEFQKTLARMVYGTFCFGFFFTCLGTILGGIWANESWGRFWGWDPKENGALLIVLWQLAALHARAGGYIRNPGLSMAAVFNGMVIAFSWWGVNLLGVGLHSYGFTSGAMNLLLLFWACEACVIAVGIGTWLSTRRGKAAASARSEAA